MGLDQYLLAIKDEELREIAYWRKHPNLEAYMAEQYRERFGDIVFNNKELELDFEDLLDREEQHSTLPEATGFFWGKTYQDQIDYTQKAIELAFEYINHGYKIIYTSCW